ncbi:MAG: DNA repair protein RecO [Eggerthellaceae bacterium]|nr:DNA repair protein RecO [Eggerthellaceae bacterium]
MATQTYKTRGIVLRKTKLGEKDLIVTILDESGSLVRAVAKGARKPGGSYAARLELFSIVDLMLAKGRNLDIITSAAFSDDEGSSATFGIEQSSCASVLAEILSLLAQEDLPHERLYDMSRSAFERIAASDPKESLALTCSALLKALAYTGFRPSFSNCVVCGCDVELLTQTESIPLSIEDGGSVCRRCTRPSDAIDVDANVVQWADALMRSRFDDVSTFDVNVAPLFDVLQLARQWTRVHVGKNLKSVDFLLVCGLF